MVKGNQMSTMNGMGAGHNGDRHTSSERHTGGGMSHRSGGVRGPCGGAHCAWRGIVGYARLRAWLGVCIALCAMCMMIGATVFAATPRAHATPEYLSSTGGDVKLIYKDSRGNQPIGALARDARSYYYCIESRVPMHYWVGSTSVIEHDETARRLAWLMKRYDVDAQYDYDDDKTYTHAAIAFLVHEYFDLLPDVWQLDRVSIARSYPRVIERAEQLWQEAGREAPVGAKVVRTEAYGLGAGEIEVAVTNAEGQAVAGVPYTAVIDGPAVFDNGEATIDGVSATEPVTHSWTATGKGAVEIDVQYDHDAIERLDNGSRQDLIHHHERMVRSSGKAITLTVDQDPGVTLRTRTTAKSVDAGEVVIDDVISGVAADGFWPDGKPMEATGWYFDGITAEQVHESAMITPSDGERAKDFLARLAVSGFEPVAYATALFTAPDQTVSATAMTEPGGDTAYRVPSDGGFGTWVWAFERDRQDTWVRDRLEADVVTGFLDPEETNANRSRVQVASSVAEHVGVPGLSMSDTITVTGFPDDHGSFAGDETFGFAADEPYAQVSVWWAGDPDNPANDDQYRPQGATVPQEDANHQLIGTWDFPATNGVHHVGGEAPDAHGNPVTITARTHGWYVFVWSFRGDDRVQAASSAYDDPWERVRIQQPEEPPGPPEPPEPPEEQEEPAIPTLNTQVDPEQVNVGEVFRDSARIIGAVPEGAYVTFTAYQAIAEGEEPGFSGTLLDEVRVEIDVTLQDQTVYSPQVSSPIAGLVYWRASLMSADGDVLASHELGVEGEIVTIEEIDEPGEEEPPALPPTGADIITIVESILAISVFAIAALLIARARRA
ncbi:peptidase [Bifidobacterium goeldii]|uniref:Peptidase n=2 Tax=Bifidobacterium goeldii TaxID=2306975 RepID=A0A430FDZ4_9BIFI|nr:peptidase [Bifidobacterium goeldii]